MAVTLDVPRARGRPLKATGRKLDRALDGYGVPHDVKVYPGARHSFFNDLGKTHNPEAAADSWQRTLAFFERYLRSAAPHR